MRALVFKWEKLNDFAENRELEGAVDRIRRYCMRGQTSGYEKQFLFHTLDSKKRPGGIDIKRPGV